MQEVVTIDAQFLVGAFSFVVGILVVVIVAYLTLWKKSIISEIHSCSERLRASIEHIKEHSMENRRMVSHAHDRITDVIKEHRGTQ